MHVVMVSAVILGLVVIVGFYSRVEKFSEFQNCVREYPSFVGLCAEAFK